MLSIHIEAECFADIFHHHFIFCASTNNGTFHLSFNFISPQTPKPKENKTEIQTHQFNANGNIETIIVIYNHFIFHITLFSHSFDFVAIRFTQSVKFIFQFVCPKNKNDFNHIKRHSHTDSHKHLRINRWMIMITDVTNRIQ